MSFYGIRIPFFLTLYLTKTTDFPDLLTNHQRPVIKLGLVSRRSEHKKGSFINTIVMIKKIVQLQALYFNNTH